MPLAALTASMVRDPPCRPAVSCVGLGSYVGFAMPWGGSGWGGVSTAWNVGKC